MRPCQQINNVQCFVIVPRAGRTSTARSWIFQRSLNIRLALQVGNTSEPNRIFFLFAIAKLMRKPQDSRDYMRIQTHVLQGLCIFCHYYVENWSQQDHLLDNWIKVKELGGSAVSCGYHFLHIWRLIITYLVTRIW